MPQGGGAKRKRNRKSSGTEGESDTSKLGRSVKGDLGMAGRAEAETAKDPGAEDSEARVTKRGPSVGEGIEAGGAKDPRTGEELRPGEQSRTQ